MIVYLVRKKGTEEYGQQTAWCSGPIEHAKVFTQKGQAKARAKRGIGSYYAPNRSEAEVVEFELVEKGVVTE